MIASVSGKVLTSSPVAVTLEVGGVGLIINTTSRIASSLPVGQQVSLRTVLIVREDSLTLYGFLEALELETFDLLRSVNGVGPKLALSILNSLSVHEIADAVAGESDAVFRSVSGVGVKTAKLIAVSLAGKLNVASGTSLNPAKTKASVEALVGLGYSEKEATIAVAKISNQNLSDQEILKFALQQLAKGGSK